MDIRRGGAGVTRRAVSNPLALAVLCVLLERPMHPYEMSRTLRERNKEGSIRLNYGSLYAVVDKLLQHGFIEPQETSREGRRPERTVYRLTGAGRAEFEDWLAELLSTPVKEYTQFEAGLALMPGLPPEEVVRLLEQRCTRLEHSLATWGAVRTASATTVPRLSWATTVPRLYWIEWEYACVLAETELRWTRDLIREIRDGTFDGLDEWRRFHAEERPARDESPAAEDHSPDPPDHADRPQRRTRQRRTRQEGGAGQGSPTTSGPGG
jgi:DNA-binding PadR family transcriptional regulator